MSCSKDKFSCTDGGCVSWTLTCNGEKNCEDGTDEPSFCKIFLGTKLSERLSAQIWAIWSHIVWKKTSIVKTKVFFFFCVKASITNGRKPYVSWIASNNIKMHTNVNKSHKHQGPVVQSSIKLILD